MTQYYPTFARVRMAENGKDGGTAATYNASEATAWLTANTGWTAPAGRTDPAESTYLQSCLTAAVTAGYTPGSQTGGVGPYASLANGVGMAIILRLLALGVNKLTS